MSIKANNNKETFKLLDVSSDTDSDNLQIEIVPRKRRVNRSRRGRSNQRTEGGRSEAWGQRAATIGITIALLAWLAILSWAAAALEADTRRLDAALKEVSMGSQGVGDALQRCHSTARELQHNHTEMAAKLDRLILRTDNLTAQVVALQSGLASVKQQVANAPELVKVPQQLESLGTSVAEFGSQIKDFDSKVAAFRAQSLTLSQGQTLLLQNITQLKTQVDLMQNMSISLDGQSDKKELAPLIKQQSDLQATLTQLSSNFSSINETLAMKIDWATQNFQADHHKVSELLESVQNNSAVLSSLQTAWKQSNDILSHNITDLSQKVADKSAEVQREILDLKRLIDQLQKAEAEQMTDLNNVRGTNSNSIPADVAAGKDDSPPVDNLQKQYIYPLPLSSKKLNENKNLHERDSDNFEQPKNPDTPTNLPPSIATTSTPRPGTGKPSILS